MKEYNKLYVWLDRYWMILIILFGLAFTFFLALFKPHIGWGNY